MMGYFSPPTEVAFLPVLPELNAEVQAEDVLLWLTSYLCLTLCDPFTICYIYIYIILTENDQLLTMLYVLTRFLHVLYDSMHKYLFCYFVLSVTVVYNAGQ